MNPEQRIAQFENMAKADPDNEMAHFSLAGAYAQAGRHEEAGESYAACTKANPDMSRAYQLAGECFVRAGKRDRAVALFLAGYEVAARLGDLMPKKAIASALADLGEPLPDVADEAPEEEVPEGSFMCSKTGRPGTQLDRPPFRGPVGEWIRENISKQTWEEWIGQGTKVINELRLDLSRDEDAETYDSYMHEFLGLDSETLEQLRSGAAAG